MMAMEFEKQLSVAKTNIPGLLVLDLTVHGDERGWFKENWHYDKMSQLGLPNRRWVQNNISYNDKRGATRGIHAEPWDKLISIASGAAFGAWVDLRPGDSFGQVFTMVLDPSKAIYVPRGVGNSYQALEDGTVYTYLVDAHWSADLKSTYLFVNLADPHLGIQWPIPLSEAIMSRADSNHPMLEVVKPMAPRRTLVTGANGQLGRAIRVFADAHGLSQWFDFASFSDFDFSEPEAYMKFDWSRYGTVINCAAYTAVDKAETSEGRIAAWKANAVGPALLTRTCVKHDITLVHISSDYVFDGTRELHNEEELLSPLSVYGQSKAAGDLAVAECPHYYILRSSWVVGDGRNFVKTMKDLSDRCADSADDLKEVAVIDDQFGRLTFAEDMAAAIFHLLGYRKGFPEFDESLPYGIYNCTCSGRVSSWAEIAYEVFETINGNGDAVRPVSTREYYSGRSAPVAQRPKHSSLNLLKLETTGFRMSDWKEELKKYVKKIDDRALKSQANG